MEMIRPFKFVITLFVILTYLFDVEAQRKIDADEGLNKCMYKLITSKDGKRILAWTCSLPDFEKDKKDFIYDCCPGYIKSNILDDQCAEKMKTYKTIDNLLEDLNRSSSADAIRTKSGIPDIQNDKSNKDYTFFAPEQDSDMNLEEYQSESALKSMIADGRWYSENFKDGAEIPTKNDRKLKVSSYKNGLIFIECQLLSQPDVESKNGVLHILSEPIPQSLQYTNVLQRLEADPQFEEFVADIPEELKRQMRVNGDGRRFTVLAPKNNDWRKAKQSVRGENETGHLVRQHIIDHLICGRAINDDSILIGPTTAGTLLNASMKPDGKRVVTDSCGSKAVLERMDLMSGNGVVHVLDKALTNIQSLSFDDALKCLAGKQELSRAAEAMLRCNLRIHEGKDNVVLMPTREAYAWASRSTSDAKRFDSDSSFACQVYSHHLLKPKNCKIDDTSGLRLSQECMFETKFETPNRQKSTVSNLYIQERDGSKLLFNQARTSQLKPIKFKDGLIFPVDTINIPPKQTIMDIISSDKRLKTVNEWIEQTSFVPTLKENSPNLVFIAAIDDGWKSRDKENNYSPSQKKKFLQLHSIPRRIFSGDDQDIWRDTIQSVDSLLAKGNERENLKIKKDPSGQTFIGHDKTSESDWSLLLERPKVGTDGEVWIVDWPMKCDGYACD